MTASMLTKIALVCVVVAAASTSVTAAACEQGWLPSAEVYLDDLVSNSIGTFVNGTGGVPWISYVMISGDDVLAKTYGINPMTGEEFEEDDMPIARMDSVTKLSITTLALIMSDKGWLRLDDPVSTYIEEFDVDWKVVRTLDTSEGEIFTVDVNLNNAPFAMNYTLEDPIRAPTVRDLLYTKSGLGYPWYALIAPSIAAGLGVDVSKMGHSHVSRALQHQACAESDNFQRCRDAIIDLGYPHLNGAAEFASFRKIEQGQNITSPLTSASQLLEPLLGASVLINQPGMMQSYGMDWDVLGVVLERAYAAATGEEKRLQDIIKELLWDPLGMEDTFFFMTPGDEGYEEKLARFVYPVRPVPDAAPGYTTYAETAAQNVFFSGPVAERGGDGSVSTAADQAKLLKLYLDNGLTQTGERLLRGYTVRVALEAYDDFDPAPELEKSIPYAYLIYSRMRVPAGQLGEGARNFYDRSNLNDVSGRPTDRTDGIYWVGLAGGYYTINPYEDVAMMSLVSIDTFNNGLKFGMSIDASKNLLMHTGEICTSDEN